MGLFEGLEYPDNENRATRAGELANDLSTLISQLSTDKSDIQRQLADADQAIKDCYNSLTQDKPDIKTVDVNLGEDWAADISEMIEPFAVYPAVTYGLQRAAKSFLLSEGRIGEAAFADLVGLPRWFEFGKFAGGVAAVVAVAAIVDAISGAIRRDNLRDMIHEQVEPRIQLKKASMINAQLKASLNSIIMTFNTLKSLGIYTKDQLDQARNHLLDLEKAKVDAITDDKVKEELSTLDKNRGSWTNEDN